MPLFLGVRGARVLGVFGVLGDLRCDLGVRFLGAPGVRGVRGVCGVFGDFRGERGVRVLDADPRPPV